MNKNIIQKYTSVLLIAVSLQLTTNKLQAQDTTSAYILTPKESPLPKINGPKLFGVRPKHPILFTIPATGKRPMTFSADNLPAGVKLDTKTGRLSGSIAKAGEYKL